MTIKQLVVLGSTSSIAKALLPTIEVDPRHIFTFDRANSSLHANTWIPRMNQFQIHWGGSAEIERNILDKLSDCISGPVLLINFMGMFGKIQKIENLDIEDMLSTFSGNVLPFLLAAKIAISIPRGSSVVSFSGAGVGGDNLDDSSIGYLAAKSSMGLLTEVIDHQLSPHGNRYGLISPGAFPSRMQAVVAEDLMGLIPESRKIRAQEVMKNSPSTEKLTKLIHFLAANPDQLGGRTWSANFDELRTQDGNFGKLRRVY